MLELFHPLWNLDYKSPAGIFVFWRFSLFQKRYIPMCMCVWVFADTCAFVLLSKIYQAAIHREVPLGS